MGLISNGNIISSDSLLFLRNGINKDKKVTKQWELITKIV